ncbi:DUF2835 family protein [Neiella litorisoli]|uniref:DUF2835 family protein n=1 Tax=Neiella litorisoli TaxID=2771431 RepID=UPI001CD0BE38|nr:DUF2835 family protein [Neiella litorisoli]
MGIDYQIYVDVSYHELQALYNGAAQRVVVREKGGKTISLAAVHFKPFLTHAGIRGWFLLKTAADGKFISLRRLQD